VKNKMTTMIGIGLAIIVGMCISLQPVFNSNVGKATGVIEAVFISIAITFTSIALILLVVGKGNLSQITTVPKYFLLAGLMGAAIVSLSIICIRILGPATAISIYIAAQIFFSVIIEHYGLFNINITPISLMRMIGIACMIVGVFLIKGFKLV